MKNLKVILSYILLPSILLFFYTHEGYTTEKFSSEELVINKMVIKNLTSELDQAILDPKVKIKIASLAGDNSMAMHATVLTPGSKVTAHVHAKDIELYYILQGGGEIYTGTFNEYNKQVTWDPATTVKAGDAFSIAPGLVHQLKNTSESEDLTLLFICPRSHLKEDRIITSDFKE